MCRSASPYTWARCRWLISGGCGEGGSSLAFPIQKLGPDKRNSYEPDSKQTKREDAKLVHRFKWELDKYLNEVHHNLLNKTNPTSLRRRPGRQRPPTGAADVCLSTCRSAGPSQGCPAHLLPLLQGRVPSTLGLTPPPASRRAEFGL